MDDDRRFFLADTLDENDPFGPFVRPGETIGVSRKKILLRLLAAREAPRLGLAPAAADILRTTEAFKRRCEVTSEPELERWLSDRRLDRADFEDLMRQIALVDLLDAHLDEEIRRDLPLQRGVQAGSLHDDERWTQLNVELASTPNGPAASAVRVFDRVRPLASHPTRLPGLHRFFLMRKPPGLRMRLGGEHADPPAACFADALQDLEREGVVTHWSVVPYEPERFRFGSRTALAMAHAWFDADSVAWMRWESLAYRRETSLSREVLSLGILNDLFFTAVHDEAEVWDVWCRVAVQHRIPLDAPASRVPAAGIEDLLPFGRAAEQELLRHYVEANRLVASSLRDAARSGDLTVGPRLLLATLALFHWNRYGLSLDARRQVVGPMLRALDPHRGHATGDAETVG